MVRSCRSLVLQWISFGLGQLARLRIYGPSRIIWILEALLFPQRSPGERDAIVGRGVHGRTGALLKASTHMSLDPHGAPAQEIQMGGAVFIGRTVLPNTNAPTVRYYALARTDLGFTSSRPDSVSRSLQTSVKWLWEADAQSTFMFAQ